MIQKQRSRIYTVFAIAAIIAVFITVFLMVKLGLELAYGFENATIQAAYDEVMNKTVDAANKTDGMAITQYVDYIEKQLENFTKNNSG